jgi:6-phosphogluconolactonase (cycloisomerase 2 family)
MIAAAAEAVQRWAAFFCFLAAQACAVWLGVESNKENLEGNGTMMGLLRRVAAAVGVLTLCWTTGCDGFWVAVNNSNSSGSTTNDYVYVANANVTNTTASLAGFAVGTGTLTAVTGSPYALTFYPTAVAVNPANSIVFVAGSTEILAFAIQSDGSLSTLSNGGAVGYAVSSMDISPDGQWLIALDQNNLTLDEFQINSSTGALTLEGLTTYPVLTGATTTHVFTVKFAPNGNYLFAALGTAGYVVYTFTTSSGALTNPLTPLTWASGTSANALAVSPNSGTLYIAISGTAPVLAAYTIGSGGALTPVSGSPFAVGTQPFSVVVNTAGTDVYVANRGSNSISGFSIAASGGTLTALSGSPYQSGTAVSALAVDNSGDYLLAAANGGSPDLTMYSYDSATLGKLDFSTSIATGTDPTGPDALAMTH